MFLVMVIIVVIVILVAWILKDKSEQNTMDTGYDSIDRKIDDETTLEVITQKNEDLLENQSVLTCMARYVGAVNAIRDNCSQRTEIQGGSFTIFRDESGKYSVSGFYDHDSNYGLYAALKNGRYLDYMGMESIEDGFRYNVNGIDECKNGFTPDYINKARLIDMFNSFGLSFHDIAVTNIREDKSYIRIEIGRFYF